MPNISIIMPVYNPQNFILETIESVLVQSYPEFELLIIDDGSTNNYFSEISELVKSDKRILFHSKTHTGLADTLNFGVKKSSAILIARIDADDIWHPDKLRKQLSFLDANKDIMVLGTSVNFINERNEILNKVDGFNKGKYIGPEVLPNLIVRNNLFCSSSVIYYRNLHDMKGLYDTCYKTSMDYEFIIRCLDEYKGAVLSERLIQYRISTNMMTRKYKKQMITESIKVRIIATGLLKVKFMKSILVYLDVFKLLIWRLRNRIGNQTIL